MGAGRCEEGSSLSSEGPGRAPANSAALRLGRPRFDSRVPHACFPPSPEGTAVWACPELSTRASGNSRNYPKPCENGYVSRKRTLKRKKKMSGK